MSMRDDELICRTILDACARRGAERSCCPSEIARALAADWRPLMPQIRACAARLQQQGLLRVLQGGRDVDLHRARGPIRLAALAHCVSGDAAASDAPASETCLLESADLQAHTAKTPESR